jgi:hypothetical protein
MCRVSKPADPRRIFLVAEQFRRSAGVLLNELVPATAATISMDGDDPYRMSPIIAMCAFSFELFLKCLIVHDGGTPPKMHNLKEIFAALSPSRRREIEEQYDEKRRNSQTANRPDLTVERVIEQSAGAFKSHRYIYELDNPRDVTPYTVQVLANVVQKMILALHPEWDYSRESKLNKGDAYS